MARFDVSANRGGTGFLLDVQTDLISRLNTSVVVPLLPLDAAPTPADRLNPIFEIQGSKVTMATQFMAAVPQSELATRIASLDRESDAIFSAIDFFASRLVASRGAHHRVTAVGAGNRTLHPQLGRCGLEIAHEVR